MKQAYFGLVVALFAACKSTDGANLAALDASAEAAKVLSFREAVGEYQLSYPASGEGSRLTGLQQDLVVTEVVVNLDIKGNIQFSMKQGDAVQLVMKYNAWNNPVSLDARVAVGGQLPAQSLLVDGKGPATHIVKANDFYQLLNPFLEDLVAQHSRATFIRDLTLRKERALSIMAKALEISKAAPVLVANPNDVQRLILLRTGPGAGYDSTGILEVSSLINADRNPIKVAALGKLLQTFKIRPASEVANVIAYRLSQATINDTDPAFKIEYLNQARKLQDSTVFGLSDVDVTMIKSKTYRISVRESGKFNLALEALQQAMEATAHLPGGEQAGSLVADLKAVVDEQVPRVVVAEASFRGTMSPSKTVDNRAERSGESNASSPDTAESVPDEDKKSDGQEGRSEGAVERARR